MRIWACDTGPLFEAWGCTSQAAVAIGVAAVVVLVVVLAVPVAGVVPEGVVVPDAGVVPGPVRVVDVDALWCVEVCECDPEPPQAAASRLAATSSAASARRRIVGLIDVTDLSCLRWPLRWLFPAGPRALAHAQPQRYTGVWLISAAGRLRYSNAAARGSVRWEMRG